MQPIRLARSLRWLSLLALAVAAACVALAPQPTARPPWPLTPVITTPVITSPVITSPGPIPPAPHFATATPAPTATPRPLLLNGPLTVALAPGLPEAWSGPLLVALNQIDQVQAANGRYPLVVLDQPDNADVVIEVADARSVAAPLVVRVFVVVAPFATVADDIALEDVQLRWQGAGAGPLLANVDTAQLLRPSLGKAQGVTLTSGDVADTLAATPGALAVVPFDQLDPRLKVLTVDGVNPLANDFDPATYPLIRALDLRGEAAPALHHLLARTITPATNRDPARLTTLVMTGVTAISRGTAAAIARNDALYPAAVISATLAAADITHASNEVPFLDDCVVNNTLNNLVLCSHTDYWATLQAIGTDIVGLSGNHVNDFGRSGALRSLAFYRDNAIPIYGSGLTVDEACAPLRWEHNGNTFAFVAALAFGPETAWVTDEEPGACYYYEHRERILAEIAALAATVDIVAVELQYEESYDARPLPGQVDEFRALRAAGAALVTGVQSHVPQAWEPYGAADPGGPGLIAYGLGNIFFDQMWSWETRTGQIARHAIYDGRLLSAEILTTVLEDFAQPRWTTPEERSDILIRVFNAAPPRP